MAMVKKKIAANQTKTITMPEPEEDKPKKSNVIDLVSLLQASLGKKPAPAHADDDDDDDPPPRKSRKPASDEDDGADAPPTRARKTSTPPTVHARATAAKKPAAKKAVAKTAAKRTSAAAKTAAAKAPARRRKAA
jgi:DNA end-binding protein Ku